MTIEGPHLRIGNAERAKALSIVDAAASDGRLDSFEAADRRTRASAALTRGQLATVLEGLVSEHTIIELVTGQPAPRIGEPGFSADDPLVLTAMGNNEVRLGAWIVPPFIELHPVLSSIKLNFCHASAPAVIDLVHKGGAGSLLLIVPRTWGVDMARHGKGLGSVHSAAATRPQPGGVQIVMSGRGVMGSVRVKHPGRFDEWQQRRALAKQGDPRALER